MENTKKTPQSENMEMELNFRLDGEGRTAYDGTSNDEQDGNGSDQDEASPSSSDANSMEYRPKTIMTNLSPPITKTDREDHQKWMDDLLFDAEIADSGLMPRTFWMASDGTPTCTLEQFALDIFQHHVPSNLQYDPSKSGAEWWVQIRPSPEGTGRYSMHDDSPDSISKTGISFHWDKDEELRLLTGGSMHIHPHISTVTYLTDRGCPTVALNCRVKNFSNDWLVPGEHPDIPETSVEGYFSWPKAGKHLSFDGRFLHAALPDLMESGAFKRQCEYPKQQDPKQERILKRRHRRVTFLMNVWLNYQPFDVNPFPMIDKLSGNKVDTRKHLMFQESSSSNGERVREVTVERGKKAKETDGSSNGIEYETNMHTWPLGDCGSTERLEAQIPLETIRKEASSGGNVRIRWEPSEEGKTFGLYKGMPATEESSGPTTDDSQDKTKRSNVGEAETTSKRPRSGEDGFKK
jgi:hypothetical protein